VVAPDRDKLRRSFKLPRPAAAEPAPLAADAVPPAGDRAGELLAFLQRRRGTFTAPKHPVVELPAGVVETTRHGPLWRRELRYPADFVHGTAPLAAARVLDGDRLATLGKDASFSTIDSSQCLFLDTETTGLAGGAGTVVFAYGLGFFRGDEFVLEQTFLRDFGEEPAMLHHVAERLAEFPVPVTFVGKSYDRHRIHARLAVHKIKAPVLTPRHLDLYHLVRRSHAGTLPDAKLRTVERHLLGLLRHDDLPGSEAPAAFFDWIRDRTGPVDRVLEHNRLDVLSLAALLGVLAGRQG
jgi:uncharacterized protein YprB with RNaseH-like and TPR domain